MHHISTTLLTKKPRYVSSIIKLYIYSSPVSVRETVGRKSVLSTTSTRRGDSRSHAATLPALLLPFLVPSASCLPVVLHQLQLIIIFAKLALPRPPPPRRPGPDELPYPDRKRRVFLYISHSVRSRSQSSAGCTWLTCVLH